MFSATAQDYSKTCKHIIRSGDLLGQECGKPCTFNVYAQRVDYCSSHYVWNLTHTDTEAELVHAKKAARLQKLPTYKTMILEAVDALSYPRNTVSLQAIKKYISTKYIMNPEYAVNRSTWQTHLKQALRQLVGGELVQIKASYRRSVVEKSTKKKSDQSEPMWLN